MVGVVEPCQHRERMGVQRSGAVVLRAVQTEYAAVRSDRGGDVGDGLAAPLGLRVRDPASAQHRLEEIALLWWISGQTKQIQVHEVAVRDLRDVGIGCGKDADHLGHDARRQVCTTETARHRDRQQSAGRQLIDLAIGEFSVAIASHRAGGEMCCQVVGHRQCLLGSVDARGDRGAHDAPTPASASAASSSRTSGSTFAPKYSISSWKCRKPPRTRSTPSRL